jgi:hypothetical protein
MRKRWWVAVSILIATVMAIVFILSRPAGVTWFGYARVRLGMTPEEVESVIGVPPGNYSSRKDITMVDHWASDWHAGKPGDGKQETRYSDSGCLRLSYDSDGKVVYKEWLGMAHH